MRFDIPSGHWDRMRRFGPGDYYRHRRTARARRKDPLYCWIPGSSNPVGHIIDPENLLKAFDHLAAHGGPGRGPDGITYRDVTRTEIARALREASQTIRDGQYRPPPDREVRRQKRTGGYRVLKISTIIHRTICKAAEAAIGFACNPVLLHFVHGYRPRRSVLTLLADLEHVVVQQGRWVLAIDDIRDCFPSIPLHLARSSLEWILHDQQLVNFLMMLIRGHDGGQRSVGLDQGNPLSPLVMNVCLHIAMDAPYSANTANPPLWRFADNTVVAANTVAEGQLALSTLTDLLAPQGLRLKGADGPPTDLRQPETSVNLLGFTVTRGTDGFHLSACPRVWEDLGDELAEAHQKADPTKHAGDAIRGWVNTWGMAFESAETVTSNIHRLLTENGIHEGPTQEEIGEWINRSRAAWESKRQAATTGRTTARLPGDRW